MHTTCFTISLEFRIGQSTAEGGGGAKAHILQTLIKDNEISMVRHLGRIAPSGLNPVYMRYSRLTRHALEWEDLGFKYHPRNVLLFLHWESTKYLCCFNISKKGII